MIFSTVDPDGKKWWYSDYKLPPLDKKILEHLTSKYGKKWRVGFMVDEVKWKEYCDLVENGIPVKKERGVVDTSSVPEELLLIVGEACQLPQADQYRKGNKKSINSLVGWVLKFAKFDPALVKELLIRELTNDIDGV